MKRGDVVTVATGSGFGSKPRPAVVVQADSLSTSTVLVALITSDKSETRPVRPLLDPTSENGLFLPSQIMVDVLVTSPREKVGKVIGALPPGDMAVIDEALARVLGLA